ncbi:MAG: transporter [Planctomycetota bacterium]|nr:MAG: transporter [Planctomycetota bacterium]
MKCSQCGETFLEDELITLQDHLVCAICKPMFLQKAEEGGVVSENVYQLADRGMRLVAALLDGLVLIPFLIPGVIVFAIFAENEDIGFAVGLGLMGLGSLVYGAWNISLLHKKGQTVGKKIMKIKIIYRDDSRIGFWGVFLKRYLIISFLGLIPFVGNIIGLVDVLLIFRENKACLHDDIAKTKVVKVKE